MNSTVTSVAGHLLIRPPSVTQWLRVAYQHPLTAAVLIAFAATTTAAGHGQLCSI
ncbi:hypothetical protein [Actinocrispum sp. NPDC049592]|uniref:hypothetical protein n=1 Tax=Actinocrispum sp. NPDC049592 TaxID=3154835 RepID=UPI00341FC445